MKSAIIKVAAVAAFTMLAGCQDIKPLQADIDNLKQQVSRLRRTWLLPRARLMPPMRLRSPLRRPPVARRAPPTRRSPPPRLRSPAAMPPTRRSTGCSVARSRSKSTFHCSEENAAHSRGVFFRPENRMPRRFLCCCPALRRRASAGRRAAAISCSRTPSDSLRARVADRTPGHRAASRSSTTGIPWSPRRASTISRASKRIWPSSRNAASNCSCRSQDRFFTHRGAATCRATFSRNRNTAVASHRNVTIPVKASPKAMAGWPCSGTPPCATVPVPADRAGQRFDGRVYGINLPETAADIDPEKDTHRFQLRRVLRGGSWRISVTRARCSASPTWCST